MPDVMEARVVRPLAEGWPDAWNPVALLRLFPAPSADHPPEEAFDAFDKLAARLTPADAAEVTTTDGASTPAAASTGTGTGGGSSSPRTPATRSSSRPSAAGGLDVAPAKKHPMEIDDTASIHSGGSMAAHTLAMAAARVDLEGGYVAYVVSDELLPEEVRSRVTAAPPRSRDGADSRPAAPARRGARGGGGGGEGVGGGCRGRDEECVVAERCEFDRERRRGRGERRIGRER